MIYNFGVHLEHKSLEIDVPSTTTAVFSVVAPLTEEISVLREQNVLLAAANASQNRYRYRDHARNGPRDRDRDRHNDRNLQQRAHICHACGKPGHVIRNCPTFTDKPGPSDIAFLAVLVSCRSLRLSRLSPVACPRRLLPLVGCRHRSYPTLLLHRVRLRRPCLNLRDDLGIVTGIDCPIHGVGSFPIVTVNSTGKPTPFTLVEVLYVPDLAQRSGGQYLRLLIARLAAEAGLNCTFTNARARLLQPPLRPHD